MNILFYNWNEFTGRDCRQAMEELGHTAVPFSYDWKEIREDEGFYEALIAEANRAAREGVDGGNSVPVVGNRTYSGNVHVENQTRGYSCMFSYNFFPVISRACQTLGIPYISWIFDSPHLPLTHSAVTNSVNYIFIFDRALYEELHQSISTVYYMPLGINVTRMSQKCAELDKQRVFQYDVSFLGSLYDNEFNFYDNAVMYMPEKLHGYFDGVIAAQRQLFGVDLIDDLSVVPDEKIAELNKYLRFELSGSYAMDLNRVLRDIIKKKVTQEERHLLLEYLGQYCHLALFTNPESPIIRNVYDMGRAEYMNKMPMVFHRSKINLNFTMRSIRTGIPLRCMDILGAGGFLLSGYQQELAEYFVPGEELALASTPEEMKEMVQYYLAHEEERMEIAARGQKRAFEQFDNRELLRKEFEIAGLLSPSIAN